MPENILAKTLIKPFCRTKNLILTPKLFYQYEPSVFSFLPSPQIFPFSETEALKKSPQNTPFTMILERNSQGQKCSFSLMNNFGV